MRTFHGLHVQGFPNCFVVSIAQSGFTVNFPYLLDVQASHVAWLIARALSEDAVEVEASLDAEAAWVDTVVQRAQAIAGRRRSCTPGYYNREGKADAQSLQGTFFIGGPTEYADILAAWRAAGTLDGLQIRTYEPEEVAR